MRKSLAVPTRGAIAAVLGLGLVLASCSSTQSSEGGAASVAGPSIVGEQGDGGSPTTGGTLSYATFSDVTSLDPANGNPFGTTGGTEMAAIYDLLVRYDFQDHKFVPQLAKSLDPDDDYRIWTMKLRDGVTFSDGSPLDANAVKWSIDRYNDEKGIASDLWLDGVDSTEAIDEQTVVFTLSSSWPDFDSMLALGHGMIVSPASIEGDAFTPIGAGAFTMGDFAPHDHLVVQQRSDYWDGAPSLDAIRFTSIKEEQARTDALRTKDVDTIFVRSPEVVQGTLDTETPGFIDPNPLGSIVQINNRPGRPGSDVRVRQALSHAIDPEVINTRVWGGVGLPGSEMFQESSMWHSDVAGPDYDPDKARALLAEAQADGYDGNIKYLSTSAQASQNQAVAIEAMLETVGFNVEIDYAASTTDLVRKFQVDRDFDLSAGGWNLMDPVPFMRLQNNLKTGAGNNNSGYSDPRVDQLLNALKAAATTEEKEDILADLQRTVSETVPFVTLGAVNSLVAWRPEVHGITPSLDSILLLDKAWISN